MDDLDFDSDDYDGPKRPRLRAIIITVLFPSLMGYFLGSTIVYNGLDVFLKNPGGAAVFLGISTGMTLLIWGSRLLSST